MGDKEYCLYFRKGGYCKPNNYEDAKTIYLSILNVKDKQKYGHITIKSLPLILLYDKILLIQNKINIIYTTII